MSDLILNAESLASKWGFNDGDIVDDWWWNNQGEVLEADTHEALHLLIVEHLIPAIERAGHAVELERIDTIHNPVRAHTIDGNRVDHYGDHGPAFPTSITVTITPEQVTNAIEAA